MNITNFSDFHNILGKEEFEKYIKSLISSELCIKEYTNINIDFIEYNDSNKRMVVSFSNDLCSRIFKVKYSYKEIKEYIELCSNMSKKMKLTDIRSSYLIDKWIAFSQEGMNEILHGKVYKVDEQRRIIYVKNKKGRMRTLSYDRFIGFTSRPTKTNPKPNIRTLNDGMMSNY